jgi:hypothetical protein
MANSAMISEMTVKRRSMVAEMAIAGLPRNEIVNQLRTLGIVNPRTGKSYSRQTIAGDIQSALRPSNVEIINGKRVFRRQVSETIGQWTYTKPLWNSRILLNVDTTFKDYIFFDALRRGTAAGYQIGGLFCMPIAQTLASHLLGNGISASLVTSAIPKKSTSVHEDGKQTKNLKASQKQAVAAAPKAKPSPDAGSDIAYTNAQLKLFLERNQGFIQTIQVDKYCFGNQYAIVNPDCTLAIISPETVTVQYSASDYRRPLRYIIRTKMQQARVEDIYTDEKRTLIIHYYDERGTVINEYENLIGRIPIVHFVCDRSANEIYGRPVYEAALPVMRSYDDLIYKTIEGVELIATPIPVFEGLDNPKETKDLNSDAVTYVDVDGNEQTEYVTRFDRNAGLYIGKGGSAKMLSSPVGFTKDSLDTLRQLFLLLLNHTRIPEMIWGGAIASSKASAETQMPPFIQYIKFRRLEAEGEGADPALNIPARGGLLELIDIWLRTYKLLNPAIVVGPVKIEWPELDIQNDQLKFQWGSFLSATGKISDEDLVGLSGYWDDAAAVVARAAGKQVRPAQFDGYDARLNKARLEAMRAEQNPPDDNGTPYSTDYVSPDLGGEDTYDPFGALQWQHMFTGAPG